MKIVSRILLTAVVAQVLLVSSFVSAAPPAKRGTNAKINSNAISQKSFGTGKQTVVPKSIQSQSSALKQSFPNNARPIVKTGNLGQKTLNGQLPTQKFAPITKIGQHTVKPRAESLPLNPSKLPPLVKIGNTPMIPIKPGQIFPGKTPPNPGNPPADPGNPPADPGNPPQAPHCHPCPPICLPPIWIGHHYCPPFVVGVCQTYVPGVVVVPSTPVVVPVVVEETPAQPVLQLIVGQTALLSKDGLASMPAAAALELNDVGLPMSVTTKDDKSFSFDVPMMGLSQPKTATLYLFDAQMQPLAAIPVHLVTAEMVAGVSQ